MTFGKYNNPSRKRKPPVKRRRTFEEFLRIIHNISYTDYIGLNEFQRKALEIEYKENY